MNSYFLCVTQPSNAGDLLINRMLVEELSLYGKVFVDCYNCPSDFRALLIGNTENVVDVNKEYGFTLKRGDFSSFARLLKQSDIRLYTQSPGPLNKYSKWSLRISFAIIRKILSVLNIPFVRIGCCCSTAISTQSNVIESRNVQYFVRSQNGVEFLRSFRDNGISYIPDLAYLYHYKVHLASKKKIAVISFREVTDNYDRFLQWLKDCIIVLISNGYKIVFYYQVKGDRCFMQKLFEQLKSDVVCFREDIIWYDNFDFYADKSIVISNRLHCLLMGAVFNAIPYAYVNNDKKVKKISDVLESSMGDDYSRFVSGDYNSKKLARLIENIAENQQIIDSVVIKNADQCRNAIKSIVESCNKE